LHTLALALQRRLALRGKLSAALVYPILLLLMSATSLVLIATVLVPNLAPLFADSGTEPPIVIAFLMHAVAFVAQFGWELAMVLAALVLGAVMFFTSSQGRFFVGNQTLRFKTARQLEAARLCQTLSTLLGAGTPIQTAIITTSNAVTSHLVKVQLKKASEDVISGMKLSKALEQVTVLDSASRQFIAVGEETNQVESLLSHAGDTLEASAFNRIEKLVTLLTPLMTIGLGLMIGGLIMSVMRAILSINELAR
jgi:general secretion pathway protein F